jgi:eukaryotic-like serine/threonine-protein kinase
MTLVGQQIGRYRILEQVGQGGMSVVYKGLDTALEREVAVKVLHPHLAQKPESRLRLLREARAVARLKHPNILEVFDYAGEGSPEAYLVTEYIRGQTLREFINHEALAPPELAAMVVLTLAEALAHAHEAGVLHRDLKPENVMVREDGVLKLMDFGIAKILDRDEKMTMTGALVGSPAHMAPEIIEGEAAGAEADVFSLGTMLYLFATGKLPFSASNTTATLKRILDGTYDDPRQLQPTISDGLARIVATCLARRPADRYPGAGALAEALEALLGELGLVQIDAELKAFFLSPASYRQALVARLVEALLARAEALAAERRVARAMAALDQVLAHAPHQPRAQALLADLQARSRRDRRRRTALRAAVGVAAGLAGLGVVGAAIERATRAQPFTVSGEFRPEDVRLASVSWPGPPTAGPPPAPPPVEATGEALPPAGPAEPSSPRHAAGQASPPPPTRDLVEVAVVVRPFGVVRVDGGPPSAEPLARHALRLRPGPHRFVVSCAFCDPDAPAVERTVRPGEDVLLVAPLKPSRVSFSGYPDRAQVQIGAEEHTVAEARERPFQITTPPGGSPKLLHLVDYTVTVDGQVLERAGRWVEPGRWVVIERGAR